MLRDHIWPCTGRTLPRLELHRRVRLTRRSPPLPGGDERDQSQRWGQRAPSTPSTGGSRVAPREPRPPMWRCATSTLIPSKPSRPASAPTPGRSWRTFRTTRTWPRSCRSARSSSANPELRGRNRPPVLEPVRRVPVLGPADPRLDRHQAHPKLAPCHALDLGAKVDRRKQLHRDTFRLGCGLYSMFDRCCRRIASTPQVQHCFAPQESVVRLNSGAHGAEGEVPELLPARMAVEERSPLRGTPNSLHWRGRRDRRPAPLRATPLGSSRNRSVAAMPRCPTARTRGCRTPDDVGGSQATPGGSGETKKGPLRGTLSVSLARPEGFEPPTLRFEA